jgi:hypothetical protein
MTRGIYLLANDYVLDHAVALAASIRARDAETPLQLLPYDERFQRVADVLGERFGVRVFDDLERVKWVLGLAKAAFGEGFFRNPNNLRKQACWFGSFDEFLYLDADIVVFERIVSLLDHLASVDFVSCDDQHQGGLAHVFSERMLTEGPFAPSDLKDVFNAGLWGARKGLISEQDLADTFAEAAGRRAWLDFSRGGSDQPVMNYLVLSRVKRRVNVFRSGSAEPRMWAGTRGFRRHGDVLIDPAVGRPLRFLHWAGQRIGPGGPYWDVWKHYRYLDRRAPSRLAPHVAGQPAWRRLAQRLRRLI